MLKVLFVAIGGAFGALSRYSIGLIAAKLFPGSFPLGTLTVNVLGSFLITFIATHFMHSAIDPIYRYLFITGFLGALTTFSSFTFETIALWQQNMYFLGFLNVFLNFFLSFTAGFLGLTLANYLFLK